MEALFERFERTRTVRRRELRQLAEPNAPSCHARAVPPSATAPGKLRLRVVICAPHQPVSPLRSHTPARGRTTPFSLPPASRVGPLSGYPLRPPEVRGCSTLLHPRVMLVVARRSCAAVRGQRRWSSTHTGGTERSPLLALPLGLLAGGVGSFVGIGGALLLVPLTLRVYGLKQLQANATALLPNVATCVSGAAVFHAAGDVDWTAAALVASSAALTTRVGARAAHRLAERTQKLLFGAAMCALGPAIAAKPYLQRSG